VTTDARAAVVALASAYGAVTELVSGLDDADFARATGCACWSVDALLFHLMLDAQRALMALAAPGTEPADTDAVSYWRAYAAEADADEELEAETARFATDSAAAYGRPAGLVRHWTHLSAAAVSAAERSDPGLTVATQGLRLGTDDFVQTLVVEATLHHLDLVRYLAGVPGPPAPNLALTRGTIEALLGVPTPPDWDDRSTALWLTGRKAAPAAQLHRLGPAATCLPVIR
jgi:Mycothiol maleylpyruvate isomerase N-terminal domain